MNLEGYAHDEYHSIPPATIPTTRAEWCLLLQQQKNALVALDKQIQHNRDTGDFGNTFDLAQMRLNLTQEIGHTQAQIGTPPDPEKVPSVSAPILQDIQKLIDIGSARVSGGLHTFKVQSLASIRMVQEWITKNIPIHAHH